MPTLGQIVFVDTSTRTAFKTDFDQILHTMEGDKALFNGVHKEHTPLPGVDEHGRPENLQQPGQDLQIRANVIELLQQVQPIAIKLYDTVATKDYGQRNAVADVVVNGDTLLEDVPIVHLLWLEKSVTDLLTLFRKIPVRTRAERWEPSDVVGEYRTPVVTEESTKKVTGWQTVVAAAANNGHPADVRPISNDVVSGHYNTVKFTAAMPDRDRTTLIRRVSDLLDGIKMAIVEANHVAAPSVEEGDKIFDYLYSGIVPS